MIGNVWFIVGASNGFGKAIGHEALRRGDKVVAASRNVAKMADLQAAGATVLALDITADDAALRAALQRAADEYGSVTHVINAAGYILEGPIEGASAKEVFDEFNTNVLGVMNMTRLALEFLRPQRRGTIANFGSLGSWTGGAAYAYYGATKWAVTGFTESLYAEVKPLGIDAVVIEPGYFRTGFLNEGGGNRIKTVRGLEAEYEGTDVPVVRAMLDQANDNQPGDVHKAAKVIADVLTGTGVAAGKNGGRAPMRLLLGKDIRDMVRAKMESTEALIQEWNDVIVSTDHDDVQK